MLIKEIYNALDEEDTADDDIERAKKTVVNKVSSDQDLTPDESELAVSSADKSDRTTLSQSMKRGIKEDSNNKKEFVIYDFDWGSSINSDGSHWSEWQRGKVDANGAEEHIPSGSGWEMNFTSFKSRSDALATAQYLRKKGKLKRFQVITMNQYLNHIKSIDTNSQHK